MGYHINADGEIGQCRAQIRCPFGGDDQHYITKQEAHRAYEAAMTGETFKPGLVLVTDEDKDFKKFKNKKLKKIKDIPKPTQEIGQGYMIPATAFVDIRRNDEIAGGRVTSVRKDWQRKLKVYQIAYGDGETLTLELEMEEDGYPPVGYEAWIDRPSPEDAQVRELQVSEYNMAAAVEVVLPDIKRKLLEDGPRASITYKDERGQEGLLRWNPRVLTLQYTRKYLSMVKNAQKAGLANPHNFALANLKKMSPDVDYKDSPMFQDFIDHGRVRVIKIVEALATQNDSFRPDHLDKLVLRQCFDEGERPFIDYSFKDLGTKVF